MKALICFGCFVALIGWCCTRETSEQAARAQPSPIAAEAIQPKIQISLSPTLRLGKPLKMQWKIINQGPTPLYVYSSLLQQPNTDFAEVGIDTKSKTIEIRFLSLRTMEVGPNYFPKTEFMRIDPGQSKEGRFVSRYSLEKLIDDQLSSSRPSTESIVGTWTVRSLVAYGNEVASVEKILASRAASGTDHPINPVVAWQRVAYSNSVNVALG